MRIIVIPFTGLTGRVDTQHMAFFNCLLTGADIELTVDVVQVFFYCFETSMSRDTQKSLPCIPFALINHFVTEIDVFLGSLAS